MQKVVIIAAVVAIFIAAGLIVVIFRACGGDQPAPGALTSSAMTQASA
jgi:hypothetical protein